ncbi:MULTISPECIES: hypothetical protein [unclassified Mesorhizobium]|uniref:hypothetical protein n=1 Tax=unclassified Mesorhizobium TaxID=325217 RepID=UPI0030158089
MAGIRDDYRLTDKQRATLIQMARDGYEFAEIAERFGVHDEFVKEIIQSARKAAPKRTDWSKAWHAYVS